MSLLFWSAPTYARFFDVADDHPYGTAIDFLTRKRVVEGYENRSYQPERNIDRAEFTKILMLMIFPEEYIASCLTDLDFPDVPHQAWYTPSICAAWVNGVVHGFPNGNFHPEEGVKFVEAAKMLSLAFGLTGMELPDFGLENVIWYTPYVAFLEVQNAIPASIVSLDQPINRGEMAEMMYRLSGFPAVSAPTPLRLSKDTETVSNPVDWKSYRNGEYTFGFSYPNVWPDPYVYPKGYYDGRNPYYRSEWSVFFGPASSAECSGWQECPFRNMWIDGYAVEDADVILRNIENDEYLMTVEDESIINGTPSLIVLETVDDCRDKRSFHFGKQWVYSISMRCGGDDEKLYRFFEELVQTFEEVKPKLPEHTK